MSGTLPTIITAAGLQPQSPASLLSQLLASVAAQQPGYTANLPGSLIEDISSTAVAAIALIDSARVDYVNSLTPYGANAFTLAQLGVLFGIPQYTSATNTSVYVVFNGPLFYPIPAGFLVTDGTYTYAVQTATTTGSTAGPAGTVTGVSTSAPVLCIATTTGSWTPAVGAVNQISSQVPSGVGLTVTNPTAGTPGAAAITEQAYRAIVLQAWQASATGLIPYLKTQLALVPGVNLRLIAVKVIPGTGYEVICGGSADPSLIAGAIYNSQFDLSSVVGSTMGLSGVTQANPGVVTTVLNHGFTTGQVVTFAGVQGMTALNTGTYTITVLTSTTFSVGVNTSGYGAYTGGGYVLPNLRNITIGILDYPDQYNITFVNPPAQIVNVALTWNTNLASFNNPLGVANLGQTALVNYINSIAVGAVLNLFELQAVFQQAIASLVPTPSLTRMVFSIELNGIAVSPTSGTGLIAGDPESYFVASALTVSVTQG